MNEYAIPELDVESVAKAIEADFGEPLPNIRKALTEAKEGIVGRVHTPEEILARKRGRPVGTVKANPLKVISLRVDGDTLERWRATGKGWQTRAAAALAAAAPSAAAPV